MKGLKEGLLKTRKAIGGKIHALLRSGRKSNDLFYTLEEVLITSDMGVETSMTIIDRLKRELGKQELLNEDVVMDKIKGYVLDILRPLESPLKLTTRPYCIMVVGVNGVGKTTVIGKLAYHLKREGRSVLLAASDTFRAAAIEQLEEWAKRVDVDVVKHGGGGDPGAVAFDAVKAATSRDIDAVIVDTAGRLHTRINLMEELKKVKRVMDKALPGAPHEILLVLDAVTGQNALQQAISFHNALGVTGIVLTKLDGTARGGILVAIGQELKIPIRFVGIGEGIDELITFDAHSFVEALQ